MRHPDKLPPPHPKRKSAFSVEVTKRLDRGQGHRPSAFLGWARVSILSGAMAYMLEGIDWEKIPQMNGGPKRRGAPNKKYGTKRHFRTPQITNL